MKKLLCYCSAIILCMGFSMTTFAQTVAAVKPNTKFVLTEAELQDIGGFGADGKVAARSFDNRYEGIKGSPLWYDLGFERALVKFRDKVELVDIDANLDLENHQIYLRLDKDGQIFKMKASKIEYVQFEDGSHPFYSIRNKEMAWAGQSYAFAQLIHQGKYSLVKATNKVFQKADFTDAYSTGTTFDEYQTKESYWFSFNGRSYSKIKLGKKGLQKALSKKAKLIGQITKEEKLDLKNEADVKFLLEKIEESLKK